MSNMSYCRFHNTYFDLVDCRDALEEMQEQRQNKKILAELQEKFEQATDELEVHMEAPPMNAEEWQEEYDELSDRVDELCEEMDELRDEISGLSKEEYRYASQLLDLCREIGEAYDDEDLIEEDI